MILFLDRDAPSLEPSLLRRLQLYDPWLKAGWNREIERWQLGRQRPFTQIVDYFFTVQHPDGSFRPLDERVFEDLAEMDRERRSTSEMLRSIDDHNRKINEAAWRAGEPGRRWHFEKSWRQHISKLVQGTKDW